LIGSIFVEFEIDELFINALVRIVAAFSFEYASKVSSKHFILEGFKELKGFLSRLSGRLMEVD
jgi:hypothetical protein